MTPTEKAKSLVQSFVCVPENARSIESCAAWIDTNLAKRCALIAVNELIKEHTYKSPISWNVKQKAYWESVKEEINKL